MVSTIIDFNYIYYVVREKINIIFNTCNKQLLLLSTLTIIYLINVLNIKSLSLYVKYNNKSTHIFGLRSLKS